VDRQFDDNQNLLTTVP